jgi:3D (Asp-Asp-Asp) domain-containing protein
MWAMKIARSIRRKAVITAIAAGAFIVWYETTILDSRYASQRVDASEMVTPARPGARLTFYATAYCKGLVTKAGVAVQAGHLASDPTILPTGSVVQLEGLAEKYNGIYSVVDTGPEIQGREIDVYMWNCYEALDFGRRPVGLTVLRLGWNPKATTPSFMDRFFRRPESTEPEPLPARPLSIAPTANQN